MKNGMQVAGAGFLLLALCLLPALGRGQDGKNVEGGEPASAPLFRFGLLSDVQYADKEAAGARRYRDSLGLLERCVDDLSSRHLAFVAHCGDIIDGGETEERSREDLCRVLDVFARMDCEVRHVLGNHCLSLPRVELLPRLGLSAGHYSFAHRGWRFLVVDALALSTCGVPPDSPEHREATAWLEEHRGPAHPNAAPWNGGLGEAQRAWLRRELVQAEEQGERVVVFSHLPVLAAASTEHHLLWDHAEVLEILDGAHAFAAWINGHDHAGGFAMRRGAAHVTLPGMVEADAKQNAYAVVEVHADRLEILGVGGVTSRTLRFAKPGRR